MRGGAGAGASGLVGRAKAQTFPALGSTAKAARTQHSSRSCYVVARGPRTPHRSAPRRGSQPRTLPTQHWSSDGPLRGGDPASSEWGCGPNTGAPPVLKAHDPPAAPWERPGPGRHCSAHSDRTDGAPRGHSRRASAPAPLSALNPQAGSRGFGAPLTLSPAPRLCSFRTSEVFHFNILTSPRNRDYGQTRPIESPGSSEPVVLFRGPVRGARLC